MHKILKGPRIISFGNDRNWGAKVFNRSIRDFYEQSSEEDHVKEAGHKCWDSKSIRGSHKPSVCGWQPQKKPDKNASSKGAMSLSTGGSKLAIEARGFEQRWEVYLMHRKRAILTGWLLEPCKGVSCTM
jgi:hypothetical protein